jgi:hypothetical protein
VYDVKVVAGPESKWQEGVRVREGKNTALKVALASQSESGAALPEGDLPAQGDELPEGEAAPDKPDAGAKK